MAESNNIKIRKCPYCFRQMSNEEAGFLLRSEGLRFISPALNDVAAPKRDLQYFNFWSSMGIAEESIDANRAIIDNDILTQLNQELTASGKNLAVKHYDEASCGYSFYAEEGAVTLYSNSMICPHCHNVLPQNFFKHEMMMVGMAGSVASGKTVYLCSLMMNRFFVLQRENLAVRYAGGNAIDANKLEMEKNAETLFHYGICPEATSKSFRKPLFLELTYRLGEKVMTMLVAIYDVAGELIRESTGNGRTNFVRHMDGFICLVDPAQMHLEHSVMTRMIPDEDLVLGKLHLMTEEEQIAFQRMSNTNGKQLVNQDDFMTEKAYSDAFLYERKVDNVLESLRAVLGDQELKKRYMALTIAKSDLLEELGEIKAYQGSSLIFERKRPTYGFLDMDHHFLRQNILKAIFDDKVFRLQQSLDDYKESSLFAVSALGCETEEEIINGETVHKAVGSVKPIRVEEPLMWMIMKYMQEKGWLE